MLRRLAPIIAGCWTATALAAEVPTPKERHDIRVIVEKYARCVVLHHHDAAKKVLMANLNNNDIVKKQDQVIDSQCMYQTYGSGGVVFGSDTYRYALADALVRDDFQKSGPENFDDRLPLASRVMPAPDYLNKALSGVKSDQKKKEIENRYNSDRMTIGLSAYGECVARRDPVGVRLWILTEPDVPEELSRINALMPAFEQCMPSNMTLKFARELLRGSVALNYYRLANATIQPKLGAVH